MYDIHSHILPGVDDGSRTPDETVCMAKVASNDGTTFMLATPHRKDVTEKSSVHILRKLLQEMNKRITADGIELTLLLGMENHLDLDLPRDYADGLALPINESKYMLVEMPFFGRPNYVESVLFDLQIQGLTPILAHPERIEAFQKDLDFLVDLIGKGMITQITAGSIMGHFGNLAKKFTKTLMKRGLCHILASDTHMPNGPRSPKLSYCVEEAGKLVGPDAARAMVLDNPKAVLDDSNLVLNSLKPDRSTRKWWTFWVHE